ncbi:hypothetical protein TPA0907_34960 [Micromonospora humidisoli]|uniref:hypothetical protein n=1 Tax=Micromonospora sp. AKA109 TaxID=2733865 RepID=UPI0022C49CDA|nr:hypothetical protein [Micromonospora sp. AKA109]GHJ09129.1 hypothetical protein TPA0907_34960 [Micromonospora sp. AKA109]
MVWSRAVTDPGPRIDVIDTRAVRPTRDARSRRQQELVGRLLRCYPVSFLVLAPYALLILPMAVFYDNPQTGFIVLLVGLALLGSVSVETLGLLFGRPDPQWRQGMRQVTARYPYIYPVARLVTLTSIAADLLGAYLGRGSIVAQISGELSDAPMVALTKLFSGWGALGFALLVASHLGGRLTRGKLYGWLAALVTTQAVVTMLTALTAPLIAFLFFVVAAGVVCGVFRLRYLLLGTVVMVLLWPSIFDYRNEIRQDQGIEVSDAVTAADRIRLDRQLTLVAGIDVPVDLGQPGLVDHLRYGLVPRIVDPDRPALSTGQQINQFLGGGPTSASNFLLLGNIWFFDGPVGVLGVHAFWAGFVALLLRWRARPGPARLSLFCLVCSDVLLWSGTYPESTIAFLQHVVSAMTVFFLLWLTRRIPLGSGGRPALLPAGGRVRSGALRGRGRRGAHRARDA